MHDVSSVDVDAAGHGNRSAIKTGCVLCSRLWSIAAAVDCNMIMILLISTSWYVTKDADCEETWMRLIAKKEEREGL
jgi:hypothetical protein